MIEVGEVKKGERIWAQVALDRISSGLEVWVKTDPAVEEFISSLAEGKKSDPLEGYGRSWESVKGKPPIKVYRLDQPIPNTAGYQIQEIGGPIISPKTGQVNLSFLRFVGIGGEGITFFLPGPIPKKTVIGMRDEILQAIRSLVKDYIVPIHIVLRLSSQEF